MAIKLVDVEATRPLEAITGVEGYSGIWLLVRMEGVPIGCIHMEAHTGPIPPERIAHEISTAYCGEFLRRDVMRRLIGNEGLHLADGGERMAGPRTPVNTPDRPSISVLICTRDRAESLKYTLDSLLTLDYPDYEVIIIDNAPKTDESRNLVTRYPFRYVLEPRPGLDWARNRGIAESRGDLVAFIDDDAIADPQWLSTLADGFERPETMCVTGLVYPSELETYAQELFEVVYGGFGRGFARRTFRPGEVSKRTLCAPSVGTGCNMAFRREVFDKVGLFDPAFDVGTATGGGGDLDMYHRILHSGFTIEYRPEALVRHTHRESIDDFRKQLFNYGKALMALETKYFVHESDLRPAILRFVLWWWRTWYIRRILLRLRKRERMPLRLILTEIAGSFRGPGAYRQAVRRAAEIDSAFPPSVYVETGG